MININRQKVYDKSIKTALQYLLGLKLNFDDAVNIGKLYSHLEKLVDVIKTPFAVQIMMYGGKFNPKATEPPYYTFKNSDDKADFEQTFNSYINGNEDITEFDLITVEINNDDYINLPKGTEANLTGIIKIVSVS